MAARAAGTVLVDGLLQTRPTPVGSALLVLDGRAPWGAGRCPPAGDLRASTSRLLAACDAILLRDYEGDEQVADVVRHSGKPVYRWSSRITCAVDHGGRRADLEELRRLKLGVIFGLARPDRQLSDLSELGLRPAQVHLYSDHESPSETKLGRLASGLDGWLTSSKCATKLRPTIGGRKVWILRQEIGLPDALMGALRATGDVPEGRGFTRHQPW
jgi:tetraacyldisaccharide-1-P 4'-kinase